MNLNPVWLKSYPEGVPADIDVQQYNSLVGLLDESFAKYADRTAYSFLGKDISYAQTDRESLAMAGYLQSLGLNKGDRIAIMKDGSFDQVGTPEEIVSNPATPYVREFVNDVPRAKVLSVKTVTVAGQPVAGGRVVSSTAKIETIIPMLLERDEHITVVDASNVVIGIVSRQSVASILQAEQQ